MGGTSRERGRGEGNEGQGEEQRLEGWSKCKVSAEHLRGRQAGEAFRAAQ